MSYRFHFQRSQPPHLRRTLFTGQPQFIANLPEESTPMQSATSSLENRSVRLIQDIPELGLRCGEVGVVCSTWFAPSTAYEVEFYPATGLSRAATRALLMENQIQAAEEAN